MSYSYILKKAYWWIIILALFFNLFFPTLHKDGSWSKFYSMFSFLAFFEAFIIVLIAAVIIYYFKEGKVFRTSPPWELIDPFFNSEALRAVAWILLFLNLPQIVMIEEEWFRLGTNGLEEVIVKSLGFGFAHMLFGAPFGAACILSGVGVWLSIHYLGEGINSSFWFHMSYDIWIAIFIIAVFLRKRIKK